MELPKYEMSKVLVDSTEIYVMPDIYPSAWVPSDSTDTIRKLALIAALIQTWRENIEMIMISSKTDSQGLLLRLFGIPSMKEPYLRINLNQ